MLDNSFFIKLNQISKRSGINPQDLLLVMYLESGVNPSAFNKSSKAVGLIQFIPDTLKGMGLSSSDVSGFGKLSAEEQLDFVEKYVSGVKKAIGGKNFTSAVQYYHANLFPRTLSRWSGIDPDRNKNVVVLGDEKHSPETDPKKRKFEAISYRANAGYFDKDKKGYISVGDLSRELKTLAGSSGFRNILSNFNKANSTNLSPNVGKTSVDIGDSTKKPQKQEGEPFIAKIKRFLEFIGLAENQNILIVVNSSKDFSSKLEYCRILTSALKEELNADASIHINNNDVEIECSVFGNKEKTFEAVKELCFAISDTFEYATKKIGGVKVYPLCIYESKSKNEILTTKQAIINYRKFLLKFVGK